ncbi:MAG: GIY-YIG nuclease family protein [Rubricoccaceae bacterium]|nr:GIY-YIG nuclease family protein [Rubricoccaceae bacterium]
MWVIKQYWVYILASKTRALYVGVTNDLARRVRERAGEGSAFTRRYQINRLVYFEAFRDVRDALRAEKRIKGWTRARKLTLVEEQNPGWRDLAAHLGRQVAGEEAA